MYKSKTFFFIILICLLLFFSACNDQASVNKSSAPEGVSGKIPPPVTQNPTANIEKKTEIPREDLKPAEIKNDLLAQEPLKDNEKTEFYDPQGKIDPFLPLFQEKAEESKPAIDDQPQRILTPLEKIELSQIRLVAVVIMGNKRIAMVEEATGKGYEVSIGTFIGKNQGKITEINDGSVVVTELVKDFKGKLKEQTQEIKLHKNDDEE